MKDMKKYTDKELLYSATSRCKCGAGLAYPLKTEEALRIRAWVCSEALKGGLELGSQHEAYDFAFYKIREETSINNTCKGTTRPAGSVCMTVGKAKCGQCGHEWESEPYSACGLSHHWRPGACPQCGNDCGGGGSWSSDDKRPRIEARYRNVVESEVKVANDY